MNKYDKLLNEWKILKDAEKEFKQVMGLEQEQDLVKCLVSLPPGNEFKSVVMCLDITYRIVWINSTDNKKCPRMLIHTLGAV